MYGRRSTTRSDARGRGWVSARELKVGDMLRTPGSYAQVTDLFNYGEWEPVYNLQVDRHRTYFVWLPVANTAVLEHNQSTPPPIISGDPTGKEPGVPYESATGHRLEYESENILYDPLDKSKRWSFNGNDWVPASPSGEPASGDQSGSGQQQAQEKQQLPQQGQQVLQPIQHGSEQLAQALQQIGQQAVALNQQYHIVERASGALQVFQGGTEIAAGVVGVATPTGVTQVLGGIAILHGADTGINGIMTVFTGKIHNSFTQQGVTWAATKLGAGQNAEMIGAGADLGISLITPVGIARGLQIAEKAGIPSSLNIFRATNGGFLSPNSSLYGISRRMPKYVKEFLEGRVRLVPPGHPNLGTSNGVYSPSMGLIYIKNTLSVAEKEFVYEHEVVHRFIDQGFNRFFPWASLSNETHFGLAGEEMVAQFNALRQVPGMSLGQILSGSVPVSSAE